MFKISEIELIKLRTRVSVLEQKLDAVFETLQKPHSHTQQVGLRDLFDKPWPTPKSVVEPPEAAAQMADQEGVSASQPPGGRNEGDATARSPETGRQAPSGNAAIYWFQRAEQAENDLAALRVEHESSHVRYQKRLNASQAAYRELEQSAFNVSDHLKRTYERAEAAKDEVRDLRSQLDECQQASVNYCDRAVIAEARVRNLEAKIQAVLEAAPCDVSGCSYNERTMPRFHEKQVHPYQRPRWLTKALGVDKESFGE